jgi:hypothetical protein
MTLMRLLTIASLVLIVGCQRHAESHFGSNLIKCESYRQLASRKDGSLVPLRIQVVFSPAAMLGLIAQLPGEKVPYYCAYRRIADEALGREGPLTYDDLELVPLDVRYDHTFIFRRVEYEWKYDRPMHYDSLE